MAILDSIICILIGAIGGRAVVHKDWITLVFAIVLLVAYIVNEWLKEYLKEIEDKFEKAIVEAFAKKG